MYSLTKQAEALAEDQIIPELTENGIKVMSLNLLVPDPEQAVVWRGPIIAGMVKQFWTDVVWGELDYLLVDMPPGTGDVPLTVFQSLPVDGVFIVTSPQDLVRMIVAKAVNMAHLMQVPVLGVIENYSYLVCPDCGKKIDIFGKSSIDQVAGDMQLQVAGKIPVLIHTGTIYGMGFSNNNIMEEKVVLSSRIPLVVFYPATVENGTIKFLGKQNASKYRCIVIQ